ncbi:MAG: sugar ABC transporter ATP-binding protein [Capsulimonadales bacterium]|nr:sugar ABC transporter ATP-binding protein [Capsulimonadales bacterium]
MSDSAGNALLTMQGIVRSFGAVQALRGVNFEVRPGEIVVLLGENGAGKSTLLKTITGVHQPDAGRIEWQGANVTLDTPATAQRLGIRMVYQELNLASHLTVAANICLGDEPERFPGIIDHRAVRQRAIDLLAKHRFDLDPDALVGSLGPAQRQIVEICKALAGNAKLLLLDEPTSSLGEREIEELFGTLRDLRGRGLGLVYVSHRLPECFAIGDRIVVLRDGEKVYESDIARTDTATVVRRMVGRELAAFYPRDRSEPGPVRLSVEHLTAPPTLNDVTFSARAGEVVGIFGLMGSGRSTLLSTLFGLRSGTGTVRTDGAPLPLGKGAPVAIRHGFGFITEDRKRTGLALGRSVRENLTLAALNRLFPGPFLHHGRDRTEAAAMVERMAVKTASTETPVGTLSGGNQQKVVMGRWFAAKASVLLLDEPTRGVDVGSKVEIYQRINEATADGATVLMVSSELPELLGMSDRLIVLHQGRLVADLDRAEATPERLLHFAMTGTDIV